MRIRTSSSDIISIASSNFSSTASFSFCLHHRSSLVAFLQLRILRSACESSVKLSAVDFGVFQQLSYHIFFHAVPSLGVCCAFKSHVPPSTVLLYRILHIPRSSIGRKVFRNTLCSKMSSLFLNFSIRTYTAILTIGLMVVLYIFSLFCG